MITRLSPLAVAAAGLLLPLGCSPAGEKAEDFTPAADHARKALEASLAHWQSGNPPGTIPGTAPAVEAVDSKWKSGERLKGYEILGEDTPAGSVARHFKVRLEPAKGPPREARYVVVGIDPLWVYRQEDFDRLSGMGK